MHGMRQFATTIMIRADHRDGTDANVAGNRHVARRLNERFSSTENIVFANVNAQLPELYAKNPIVSVTSQPQQMRRWMRLVMHLHVRWRSWSVHCSG